MTTLTNARAALLQRLSLQSADQAATTTALDLALNEGLQAYASVHDWWWLEEITSFSTTASDHTYSLPADYAATLAVYTADRQLQSRKYTDILRYFDGTTTGDPAFYAVRDSELFLAPAPNDSTTTVYHHYVRFEDTLSSGGDEPLIPSRYDGLWLSHAAVWLAAKIGDDKRYAMQVKERNDWIARLRDMKRPDRALAPPKVRRDTSWS